MSHFWKRSLLSLPKKGDLKKISLKISKNIDTQDFYLSNVVINESLKNEKDSSSEVFRSYKFSNIQQLRRIIRNEFANFNLE